MRSTVAVVLALAMLAPLISSASAVDETTGIWFPTSEMPEDDPLYNVLVLNDGRILTSLRTPQIYDPYTGEWTVGTPHPDTDMGDAIGWSPQPSALMDDGRVLAAGGTHSAGVSPGSTGPSNRAAIYDPDTDSWQDISSMNERRYEPSVTALNDGSVLVVGGDHGGGVQIGSGWNVRVTAERYYLDNDSWELVDNPHEPRFRHSAHRLSSGEVLVYGGETGQRERATVAEVFDPETNGWRILNDDMPDWLVQHQSVLLPGDVVLTIGGSERHELGGVAGPVPTMLRLDATSGELEEQAPVPEPRLNASAALLFSGDLLLTGGSYATDEGWHSDTLAYVYDPARDDWTEVEPMEQARSWHLTVPIDPGQGAAALVIGGAEGRWSVGIPELYYPEVPDIADRQPPPVDDDPAHRYFPVTGHYLSYGFKDFWHQSGGLPVFGYPLTTEFDEFNPDLGEDRTSQYFERQRFEYHPEHAGTPYEVQLGRLGFAEAERRDLLDTDAFLPVQGSDVESGCQYFAETQHSVCGAFLDYWQSYGLNFGDAGVSFRESLALFGYPISEDFVDPETGLQTQYFERARFEFHPDNPEEYQVLLGRLGADIVDERDW